MFLSKLDVVNAALETMGEAPLNDLEEDHSYKAAALTALERTSKKVQARGWWFNSEYLRLPPDAQSKFIYVPQDAIKVKTVEYTHPRFAQRGTRIYDVTNNKYEWDAPLLVDAVRLIEWDNLPYQAADYIGARAVLHFQRNFDGDTQRTQLLMQEVSEARAELIAEDTRNIRPNTLANPSHAGKMALIGGLGYRNRIPYTPGWPR